MACVAATPLCSRQLSFVGLLPFQNLNVTIHAHSSRCMCLSRADSTSFTMTTTAGGSAALHPGEQWRDTTGALIRAHGGAVLFAGDRCYWYGADGYRQPNATDFSRRAPNRQINVYSSTDLYNWVRHDSPAFVMPCASTARAAEGCYADRPKVIPAGSDGLYTMWLKATPFVAVAVASSPLGPFKLRARWRPEGLSVGDIGAFVDPRSRRGFLIYSVKPHPAGVKRVVRISRMSADRLNVSSGAGSTSTIPLAREAPVLFYDAQRRRYLAWTSRSSGWRANAAECFSAVDILHGPWQSEGNPTQSSTSFESQATFILALPQAEGLRSGRQRRFIYMADRCALLTQIMRARDSRHLPMCAHSPLSALRANCARGSCGQWQV